MTRVVIIHGIHSTSAMPWMHDLGQHFADAGFEPVVWTYGNVSAFTTRFKNPGRAIELHDMLLPGDVVVGHSNGCTLAYMAACLGAPIAGAVLLNPALARDKVMPENIQWVNLYTNAHDVAVAVSAAWSIGNLLPFIPAHPWGAQGRDGLSVHDLRYRRWRTELGIPPIHGHSDILSADKLPYWGPHIVNQVKERLHGD